MSFNHHYQSELTTLRQLGKRFAERSPALAPFLGQAGRDPDVERLLEGFAFLTGRLRQKLDDELPELTHSLMHLLWPNYLRPLPAFSMLQFDPLKRPGPGGTAAYAGGSQGHRRCDLTLPHRLRLRSVAAGAKRPGLLGEGRRRATQPASGDERRWSPRRSRAERSRGDSVQLPNINSEVIGADDVQILECKTAGINGARLWKEGVPEYVQLQVMHQLAVTGKQAADVAVLLGGQTLEIHRIERDEQMIARLIELERKFWQYVETDTPPPADGSASAEMALRALYPEDNGQTVDFSGHAGLAAAYLELKAVRQYISEKEAREAQLKQLLQQAMGDATRAEFSNGFISWRKAKDSIGLDVPQLLKEKPHLQTKYPLLKPGARRFLVS